MYTYDIEREYTKSCMCVHICAHVWGLLGEVVGPFVWVVLPYHCSGFLGNGYKQLISPLIEDLSHGDNRPAQNPSSSCLVVYVVWFLVMSDDSPPGGGRRIA